MALENGIIGIFFWHNAEESTGEMEKQIIVSTMHEEQWDGCGGNSKNVRESNLSSTQEAIQ